VRDGIEDYDMLAALRDAARKAKDENRSPEAVAKAEMLLKDTAFQVARFCGLDEDGTTPGKDGLSGVRTVEDRRHGVIQTVRREIAQLLVQLAP